MKKIKNFTIVMLALLFLLSCKKSKDMVHQFSATGYWEGRLSTGDGIGFLNQQNGTSRLYLITGDPDTAAAVIKYDGTYTVNRDVFYARYLFDSIGFSSKLSTETSGTTPNSMTGIIIQDWLSGTTPYTSNFIFNVIKQP